MHASGLLSPNSFQYIHSYHIISIWNELSFQTPYLRLIALATSNINILELPNLQYCIVTMFSSTGSDSESDDSDVTQYKAVTCTGRQPGSDIIIIGPELQFSSDGTLIPVEQQEYVWIPEILRKLHLDKISAPLSTFPNVHHPLRRVLKGMSGACGDNFISALFMLSECQYT